MHQMVLGVHHVAHSVAGELRHLTPQSVVGGGGASTRISWYLAPQLGQSNGSDCKSDMCDAPESQIISRRKEAAQQTGKPEIKSHSSI
jgi:hypothetical protein